MRTALVPLLLCSLLPACNGGPDEEDTTEERTSTVEQAILFGHCSPTPSDLDDSGPASEFKSNEDHQTYAPFLGRKNKLLVFLPGDGGNPANFTDFGEYAQAAGYHVIVLDFWAESTIPGFCGDDMNCYGPVRQQLWDFTTPANASYDLTQVMSPPLRHHDTVRNRLMHVLKYLYDLDNTCGDHWAQFVTDTSCFQDSSLASCQLDWSKIVLAAHSESSGEIGFIASQHPNVNRVLMFSGPKDAVLTPNAHIAPWVQPLGADADKYFGFISIGDTDNGDASSYGTRYARALSIWEKLGMQPIVAMPLSVNNAHGIVTVETSCGGVGAHSLTVRNCSGRSSSTYDAWNRMLGI